ncbi:MAG: Signal transduction histidine kinase [Acidimicrobiales bacterium]|nr:Signal transduction histidine kinase [Acidimicrobiales bacterium]
MRRRLLVAILGTVALSLVLAGAGTYLLLQRQANRSSESGLRSEAEGIVGLIGLARADQPGVIREQRIVRGLRLEGISLVSIGPLGRLRGQLPDGVTAADLETTSLLAGHTLSGRSGGLVWAAAPVVGTRGAVVAVLTRNAQRPHAPVGWFLLAGGVALAIGAGVAAWLSDSLTRPLREAEAATVRIAAGDLTSPVPEPRGAADHEVTSLIRSLNVMAAALDQSRGLERQFILSVSHDLRTPLTSIRGYADAIAEGVGQDPAEAARVIGTEARRLDRLVQDLLDLARLDSREFSFQPRTLDVTEVVVDTAEGFRPTAEAAHISLEVAEPAGALPATIDPDRLAQAVANLVENGLKYATSTLWVDVRADGAGGVAINVVDDGPGIDPADVPHVFERLYVTDRRPTRQVGGTGLGLAIVRELVAGMGGQVDLESPAPALADGRGARLVITLPPPTPTPAPTPTPHF